MFSKRRQAAPRQRRLVGKGLQLLSVLGSIMLLVLLSYPADWSTSLTGWRSVATTVAAIAALVALVAGLTYLLERGERHLAPGGADIMRSDRRAPVLYLRPFAADALVSVEERTLARIMEKEVGPLVAVGEPGDALPPLGAARFYERDFAACGGNWQVFVRHLLLRARLVLVVPGETLGLAWEMAQCREVLAPHQVVVLVRGDAKIYDAFRATAGKAGVALPQVDPRRFEWLGETDFVGLVAFGPDWTAQFSAFPERPLFEENGEDHRERRLRQGLEPVFGRLGIT